MKRRTFIKTTAVGTILSLAPPGMLHAFPTSETGYFGLASFIENNPEAVFIMRTSVDKKTNTTAMKAAGDTFAKNVFITKNKNEQGAIPNSHLIAVKPNLTARFRWQDGYTVEGSMGIVTDAYFVEGIVDRIKELGTSGDKFHIIETNYDEQDLNDGGYIDMALRTGANLNNLSGTVETLEEDEIVWKEVDNGSYFTKIPYHFPINAPNSWLINISKMKAHSMGLTLCAKNLQGTIVKNYQQHCRTKDDGDLKVTSYEHIVENALSNIENEYNKHKDEIPRWDKPGNTGGLWQELWSNRCLDNNSVTKAGLHIIEGVYSRDGDFNKGPVADGMATDYMSNIIIFGKNPFNVDIIGHWLGGHEPGNFGLFHLAKERGLSTKMNPADIPIFDWKADGTIKPTKLTNFNRTELRTKFLQKDYNGQTEDYWHLCNESFDYNATSINAKSFQKYILSQNYPNPFSSYTTIEYQIDKPEHVRIEIFNINGQKIDVLTDKYQIEGLHKVMWFVKNFPNGIYLYRLLVNGNLKSTKKMIIKR